MSDIAHEIAMALGHWLMASVRDFMLSLGWAGLAVLIATGVLAITLGMRTFKFLHSRNGIAMTVGVLLVGAFFLRWTWTKATTPKPIVVAAAPPAKLKSNPQPKLAALKIDPEPVAKATAETPKAKPATAVEFPPLVFEPEPVIPPIMPPPPVVHLPPPKVVSKPKPLAHHPAKHPAPKKQGQASRSPAPPAHPTNPPMGHAAPGNVAKPQSTGPAQHQMTPAQRKAYAAQMEYEAMLRFHGMYPGMHEMDGGQHLMNGMPHPGGMGHTGGMPHHAGRR